MYPTAELRWFFPGMLPQRIIDWFELVAPAAEQQESRIDHYLNLVGSEEMSIKLREGRLEVKVRGQIGDQVRPHPTVTGYLETWRKWNLNLAQLELPSSRPSPATWNPVIKNRSLCVFHRTRGRWRPISFDRAPFNSGCEMELTSLQIANQKWWTIAFEAFGPAQENRADLLSASAAIFAALNPPALSTRESFSYPRWLSKVT